jgi:2-amino-4-hydroxy-6-hydroxymethyldihydropteridine diphosphokinase
MPARWSPARSPRQPCFPASRAWNTRSAASVAAPWRARTLDLDIVLWSGGALADIEANLVIPHPAYRTRPFVLGPATTIAPDWRDPLTGLATKHLASRLTRRRPTPR